MAGSLKHLTDEQLVEQVPTEGTGDRIWNQAPYLLEMQRRQIDATRTLHRTSSFQAYVMIALTVAILILTAVLVWKGGA